MRIEVWSDVVCPWCYIGKRRLERALAGLPFADEVEVVYRSYELDPDAPKDAVEPVFDVLARKYGGGPEQIAAMMAQVTEAAASEGLDYHLDRTLRGNTVDAHRLLHLALADGGPRLQGALKEALLAAYFTRSENVADAEVLRKVSADVGLDPAGVDHVLASDAYLAEVHADVAQAQAFGAGGVPFFVVDRKYAVSGAQPAEVLADAIRRAWEEGRQQLTVLGTTDQACGPDGCSP
jgi:predicted DsbA family dithiol-disulfide isomerase